MLTVSEMIEQIRKSPGIIVGSSVSALYSFLSGFAYARKDTGADDYHVLAGFRNYVRDRYEITSSQSWADIIRFFSVSQPDEMELFWKLWDEYSLSRVQEEKARPRPRSNGKRRNGAATRSKRG